MHLSPKEIEKLILHNAGFLAQKRHARGILLNYPESIALISTQLLEFIREGESVATLMDKGKKILGIDDVMTGVPGMIDDVQVEGTFPDGTKLVTVHHPICTTQLNNGLALYGSGLTRIGSIKIDNVTSLLPGKVETQVGEVVLNANRSTVLLEVINSGDRPVQVGSHYAFSETNVFLKFERKSAIGFRLDIPAGTAVRFEPGERKQVQLVEMAGEKIIYGANNLTAGKVDAATMAGIIERMEHAKFLES